MSSDATRAMLLRRGLRLEYATLAWNVVGIVVVAATAIAARSVALAGFALDSGIEIFASLVVVGELNGSTTEASQTRAEHHIGRAFLALSVYIAAQAVVTLGAGVHPHPSPVGVGWLALTATAMFGLAFAKAATGRELQHPVLQAEAKVTVVDGALATATLAGLVLNAVAGWWWADVTAGLVIVGYGLREARHLLRPRPSQ